jgi:hypothetical protein
MLTKIYKNHISPIFLLFKILGCYIAAPPDCFSGLLGDAWSFGRKLSSALARSMTVMSQAPHTFLETSLMNPHASCPRWRHPLLEGVAVESLTVRRLSPCGRRLPWLLPSALGGVPRCAYMCLCSTRNGLSCSY